MLVFNLPNLEKMKASLCHQKAIILSLKTRDQVLLDLFQSAALGHISNLFICSMQIEDIFKGKSPSLKEDVPADVWPGSTLKIALGRGWKGPFLA